jgi:hypothetical protein
MFPLGKGGSATAGICGEKSVFRILLDLHSIHVLDLDPNSESVSDALHISLERQNLL